MNCSFTNSQNQIVHTPVMLNEVISFLNLKPDAIYVDATIGGGGHAEAILQAGSKVIGIDQDEQVLQVAAKRLAQFGEQVKLVCGNFRNISRILEELATPDVSGILYDLGLSSYQLDSKERGFSFRYNAPLDMRMDLRSPVKASDLVNSLPLNNLIEVISKYGQDRRAKQIAKQIIRKRPISTTLELVEAITTGLGGSGWRARIHPATRTFQALRIVVNNELDALEESLGKAVGALNKGGRLVVISFHSLEDRIAKIKFRQLEKDLPPQVKILTKSPLKPGLEEVQKNPRARSAKLRAVEKV